MLVPSASDAAAEYCPAALQACDRCSALKVREDERTSPASPAFFLQPESETLAVVLLDKGETGM